MKDIIIGCVKDYTPRMVAIWANSIIASGFDGDILVISFGIPEETKQFLTAKGIQLIDHVPGRHHIVVDRFIRIHQFLSTHKKKYRFVILTDMKDVVFQQNPVYFINQILGTTRKSIIATSENIIYQQEAWGNDNMRQSFPHLYERMKTECIFNAGVIAGRADPISDLSLHIYHLSLLGRLLNPDQAAYNFLIQSFPFRKCVYFSRHSEGFTANLGTTLAPYNIEKYKEHWLSLPPVMQPDGLYTDSGNKYFIVHQYDRVPELQQYYQQQFLT